VSVAPALVYAAVLEPRCGAGARFDEHLEAQRHELRNRFGDQRDPRLAGRSLTRHTHTHHARRGIPDASGARKRSSVVFEHIEHA
jgi:hypothetical protein